MKRFTLILAAGALLAGGATADANKGKGGGTPPSYGVCTADTNPATPAYDGSCSATNPAGRTCTQVYEGGQPTTYSCTKT